MRAPLLQVRGLACRLGGRVVLHEIGFDLAAGEVLGVIGANGAGKSTLLRCLLGLQRREAGAVQLQGRALEDHDGPALARRMAWVPQPKGAGMGLAVADVVALGRLPHRATATARDDDAAVLAALRTLRLEALALRPMAELSGGERQRVLIARALAQQCPLLLFDEPTSDLDLRHQLGTLQTVRTLARDQRVGALVVMHDLALAARFADRLLLLAGGRSLALGPWREVLTPAHLRQAYGVEAFVGEREGMPVVMPLHELHELQEGRQMHRPGGPDEPHGAGASASLQEGPLQVRPTKAPVHV
jgi:iron complex transport system ATP-binding protein